MTKIKWINKIIIYIASPSVYVLYKILFFTYKFEIDKKKLNKLMETNRILVCFHQRLFPLVGIGGRFRTIGMASQSDDGQLAGKIAKLLGWKILTGSTGKQNAIRATLSLIKKIKQGGNAGLILDGPLGPKSMAKAGAIYIASKTNQAIICFSYGANRFWQFNSWDKFRIPKPFAKIKIDYSNPIVVPSEITTEIIEEYRVEIERQLQAMDEQLDHHFL